MARNISNNTGKGRDRKGKKEDGLHFSWRWLMQCELSHAPEHDKRRLPCQTCLVEKRTRLGWWRFSAIDWHDSYEALVEFNGRHFANQEGLPTRLKAQQRAEVLVKELCVAALAELYPTTRRPNLKG